MYYSSLGVINIIRELTGLVFVCWGAPGLMFSKLYCSSIPQMPGICGDVRAGTMGTYLLHQGSTVAILVVPSRQSYPIAADSTLSVKCSWESHSPTYTQQRTHAHTQAHSHTRTHALLFQSVIWHRKIFVTTCV